jgi:alpha-beta hydrolase superfamily lysophospholipase
VRVYSITANKSRKIRKLLKIITPTSRIQFSSDGFSLHGTLHLPDRSHPPFVIGSHGLMSSSDSPKQIRLGEELSDAGIAFFRFDHRGCGQSEGEFQKVTSLDSRLNDLKCAIHAIGSRKGIGEFLGVFGSSMGGAVCLAAAALIPIPSMVTLAAPVKSIGIRRSREPALNSRTRLDFLDAPELQFDLTSQLSQVRNILIFHGDADEIVPFSNALLIYEFAGEPKQLIRFNRGDHLVSNPDHQTEFIREATAWFSQAQRESVK